MTSEIFGKGYGSGSRRVETGKVDLRLTTVDT